MIIYGMLSGLCITIHSSAQNQLRTSWPPCNYYVMRCPYIESHIRYNIQVSLCTDNNIIHGEGDPKLAHVVLA